MTFSIDASDDLPGLGQHYCIQCARHFADEATLQGSIDAFTLSYSDSKSLTRLHTCIGHKLSKLHKRRLKDLQQPQYSKDEAERAAGTVISLAYYCTL